MNINKNTGDIEINENFHVNKKTSTKEIKNINFPVSIHNRQVQVLLYRKKLSL